MRSSIGSRSAWNDPPRKRATSMSPERNVVLPRSALVVGDAEYEDISRTPASVIALQDPEAVVVPYSSAPVANRDIVLAVREILQTAGQLASGTLLILDPYETSSYVSSADALQTFVVAKYHHLAVVASLLGATAMTIDSTEVEKSRTKMRGNLKTGFKLFGGRASGTAEIVKALDEQLQMNTQFAGSPPECDAARDYIREHKLTGDHTFKALVDMRSSQNPVREYTMVLNGTKESQTNIEAAVRIATAMAASVDVDGEFATAAHSTVKIRTTITFES